MADRGIIFSAPMVRALLDGRKTQTRRVLKPQPPEPSTFQGWDISGARRFAHFWHDLGDGWIEVYGSRLPAWRGDRLWVREAWRARVAADELPPRDLVPFPDRPIWYEADRGTSSYQSRTDFGRLRPSIHMPRWASRLTLVVTEVRVQRLQEISEDDAIAEGVEQRFGPAARDQFRTLWNSLHGPEAWDANPWVVAISFDVKRGNIDA